MGYVICMYENYTLCTLYDIGTDRCRDIDKRESLPRVGDTRYEMAEVCDTWAIIDITDVSSDNSVTILR